MPRIFGLISSITKVTPVMMSVPVGVGVNTSIVGTATQVTNNIANYSDLSLALSAAPAGSTILILDGYTYVGPLSISSRLNIVGQGYGSYINGNFTLAAGSSNCNISGLRVTQFILAATTTYNTITNSWWTTEFTDAGTNNSVVGITL